MKNKYVLFGLFLVLFLVFWNLFDYLYATLITGSAYRFTAGTDLVLPVLIAVLNGYFLFLRKKSD